MGYIEGMKNRYSSNQINRRCSVYVVPLSTHQSASFITQQHSATCYIFGGGQECCCSRGTHLGEDRQGRSLPYHSYHSHNTTHLPIVLRSKMSGLNCLNTVESFINARSRLQSAGPSEDLPLVGREEKEVRLLLAMQNVTLPLIS